MTYFNNQTRKEQEKFVSVEMPSVLIIKLVYQQGKAGFLSILRMK